MSYKIAQIGYDFIKNITLITVYGFQDDVVVLESTTPIDGMTPITKDEAIAKLKEMDEWKEKEIS